MSGLEIGLSVLALLLAGLLVWSLLRLSVAKEEAQSATEAADDATFVFMDLAADMHDLADRPTRYEIVLADWGPDFTGLDGTLPRWRWVVLDADRDLKSTLIGYPPKIGTTEAPFMLGNSHTAGAAMMEAIRWVESEQNPPRVVLGAVV